MTPTQAGAWGRLRARAAELAGAAELLPDVRRLQELAPMTLIVVGVTGQVAMLWSLIFVEAGAGVLAAAALLVAYLAYVVTVCVIAVDALGWVLDHLSQQSDGHGHADRTGAGA